MNERKQQTQSERRPRKNMLLRTLIDEMLTMVREIQQHSGPWDPVERARAEADLERIMSQVKQHAPERPER